MSGVRLLLGQDNINFRHVAQISHLKCAQLFQGISRKQFLLCLKTTLTLQRRSFSYNSWELCTYMHESQVYPFFEIKSDINARWGDKRKIIVLFYSGVKCSIYGIMYNRGRITLIKSSFSFFSLQQSGILVWKCFPARHVRESRFCFLG